MNLIKQQGDHRMSDQLIVIQKEKALAILSSTDGVDRLIEEVRTKVMSLDGGSMKNKTTRNQIRSNAFKATKAKTKLNSEHIQPLIDSITLKIQPDLDAIDAIKENKKRLNAGLDQIRKDVNQEVDEHEAEIDRVKAEKVEAARLADIAERIELVWDYAHFFLKLFNLGILMTEDIKADIQRKRDEEIAKQAAENARIEAENKAKAEIEAAKEATAKAEREADDQRQAAIQAEIDLEESKERERLQAEDAEKRKKQAIVDSLEREKQQDIDRQQREKQARLDKIEDDKRFAQGQKDAAAQARLDQIERQAEADRLQEVETKKREANRANIGRVRKAQKEYLMSKGVPEEVAKAIVLGMSKNEMPHCKVIY